MARMVPGNGPRKGQTLSIQRRLYDTFSTELESNFLVVDRPTWIDRDPATSLPADGRADWLIAHPDRGIILLDVVHGGLSYDPHVDTWRGGVGSVRIDDPFLRLQRDGERLGDALSADPGALPVRPVIGHAVIVPDMRVPRDGFAGHAPADRVIDSVGLGSIAERIDGVFSHFEARDGGSGNASPRWWWRVLERRFATPAAVRDRLGARLRRDRENMLALSDEQVGVLDMLARVRRLTVYGPAGTGKTVLAIAKAHMLAEQGMRVLLTCYNKALGRHLQAVCADEPRISAIHFHELCYDLLELKQRGIHPPSAGRQRHLFYSEELPARVIAAADRLPQRYDALVVDEGQDFSPSYWRALNALCVDSETAIRYIFYDDRQRIFGLDGGHVHTVPGADEAVVLRTNWRNTRAIHGHLAKVEPTLRDTPCASPAGVPVRVQPLVPDRRQALTGLLWRLVADEGVPASDIVILSGRSPQKSATMELRQPIAGLRLTLSPTPGSVLVSSIHAYKGLESPVVILTELDHWPPERARRLYYVGASRAMNLLCVMADANVVRGEL